MNQIRTATEHIQTMPATSKVLKNTYMLLSMTLLFSACTAGIAMYFEFAGLHWGIQLLVMIGLLMLINMYKDSAAAIGLVFVFTGFMGVTLGPMLSMYMHTYSNGYHLIMSAMGGTGLIFMSLSAYVLTTGKDFSFMGGFLIVGAITLFLAMLAMILFPVPAIMIAISAVAIIIFSGFILYDTSRIIHGGETNYVMATVALYLDIYIIFVHLLSLLGVFSGED